MGNEVKCAARIAGKKEQGKALLETNELIFRGADCRLKIAFAEMKSVTATGGELRIKTTGGEFAFEVGLREAGKWREKILHPKTRAEKLGVKAGMRVAVEGDGEAAFLRELKENGTQIVKAGARAGAQLIFWFVQDKGGLRGAGRIAENLAGAAGLWMVYPKGKKEIREGDVLLAGRKAGLKDVKVVGFSPTHTALKFVIPVARR